MPLKDLEARRAYDRDRQQARYDNLTAFEFNEMLLRKRREKALRRMNRRNNKED